MKRSPLKRGTSLRSGKALRRGRGRPRPTGDGREQWYAGEGACAVCPAEGLVCEGPVQRHHMIAKQALRRLGLGAHVFDVRLRVFLCERRHHLVTTCLRPIPRELVPAGVFEFATDHDIGWLTDRLYPIPAVSASEGARDGT